MRKLLSLISLVVIMLAVTVSTTTAQDSGAIRFGHAVPGVDAVDIYINDTLAVTNLTYGTASFYINAPAGEHTVTVRPSGMGTDLWTQTINANSEIPQTFIASDASAPAFDAFEDDLAPLGVGNTRLRVIHAIAGGPAVDVVLPDEGQSLVDNLAYGEFVGPFDIPAGTYNVAVNVNDTEDAVIPVTPLGLVTGTTQFVVAYGTVDSPQVMVLTAPTAGDGDFGFVRTAHAIPDGPNVDIYAGDILIIPNLAYGTATEHLAIPTGDYTFDIRVAGTTDSILQADLTVDAGAAVTAIAQGSAAEASVGVYEDDITLVTPGTAAISVINTITGDSSTTVVLDDDTTIAEDVASLTAGDAGTFDPFSGQADATFTLGDVSGTVPLGDLVLYGGVYYNAIAFDGTAFTPPSVTFFGTALAQGVTSAPETDVMVVEIPPTAAPTEAPVEVQPTEAPAVEEPTEAPAVATDPPAPTNPPVAPVVLTEEPLPTARIILDPGVNLQLREYPSSEARSLGLAPANSTVIVNGREGDIAPNEDGSLTIPLPLQGTFGNPDFEYVDPVTQLDPNDENADLEPSDTWVNITYQTEDGGEIDAWTVALYLAITDNEGEDVPLRDLELVPSNLEGEARATDVTPPAPQEDVVTATIVGLDPTANLNIRRTPDTAGEVLGGIPGGAVATVDGVGASGDWAFITYAPAEGGAVTGWVATQFLAYQLNGTDTDIEELQTLGVIGEADEETATGEVLQQLPESASAPTPDPVQDAYVGVVELDEGANLNLRRTPDTQGEVLVQIPSGSQIIITGRTTDGVWVQTSYEGITGFVAANFLTITFNDVFVDDITEIPIADGLDATDTETDTEAETEEETTG